MKAVKQMALGIMATSIPKLRAGSRFEIRRWRSKRKGKMELIAESSVAAPKASEQPLRVSSQARSGGSAMRSIADILRGVTK